MAETYEEIVTKWYMKLRGDFMTILMDRYRNTDMRLADAEDIYQNTFIAIHRNLREGRIRTDSDWSSYIIRVGLNMASKSYRKIGKTGSLDEILEEKPDRPSGKAEEILKRMREMTGDDTPELYNNPEAKALLGDELAHTPEPCASIISKKYIQNMSDAEIAAETPPYRDNGKPIETNAKAVKARRWICMRDLIYRVKMALFNAGIIDEKPVKRQLHGK